MFLIPKLREKSVRPKVNKVKKFYNIKNDEQISQYQTSAFQTLWKKIQNEVPFYQNLVDKGKLSKQINDINDFLKFPIVTREYLSTNIHEFINSSKKPDGWGTTGGSTGNPLKFPIWKSEKEYVEPSLWYQRGFYDIKRSDRMFRLWGHSHTLGKGLTRYKNLLIFKLGLPLIGYKRFSAYDLSNENLRRAGRQIIEFKPKYIIGYSKALTLLAKANSDLKSEFHQLKLKAVIGAAEGFESEEDKEYIREIFGCPVALQYSTMETSHLAHTHPEGSYKVLWKNNLIECVDEEGNPSTTGRILITSLYPRAFPLIRYELGDIISGCKKSGNSVYAFEEVKGRDNDFLILEDGTPIHSEGITHAIKFSEKIAAYQIRYTEDNVYTIYLRSNEKINDKDIQEIKKRLGQVDPRLSTLNIKQVDQLKQTIAGKTKWLMEE